MSATLSPLFTWRSAIAHSELGPTRKLVAFVLSLHMNELGGSCFPSIDTLARKTGLSDRGVQKAIRALEESGWLVCETGGGRKANRYTAAIPEGFSTPVNEVHPSPEKRVRSVHPRGERGSPDHVIEDVLKDSDYKCHHCDGLAFKGPRGLQAHLRNVHDEQEVPA